MLPPSARLKLNTPHLGERLTTVALVDGWTKLLFPLLGCRHARFVKLRELTD